MTDNLLASDLDSVQLDPNKSYLAELVGDNKKFKSPEDLAKGKFEADQFIEIMKRRQDELRADYLKLQEDNNKKANLEELVDKLTARLASSEHTPANEVKDKPELDLKQLDTLVSERMSALDRQRQEQSNWSTVQAKAQEVLGERYAQVLSQRSKELGLSDETVNSLAKNSPQAFFKAFGLDQTNTEGFQTPPRNQQRSDNFVPRGSDHHPWSYYQELKKANPNLYNDRKITVQMAKDMAALGEKFMDGDYFVQGLHEKDF